MPKLSMLPSIVRELTCTRTLSREPEPNLVMDDREQVGAYIHAGRNASGMMAAYLFHAGQICTVLAGRNAVLDLACGPATLLAQTAELNPEAHFTGIDLSDAMLDDARAYVVDRGLTNVDFRRDDITRLVSVPDQSVDAVISTMAFHHLPSYSALECCFSQINRVLKPGGALYLADFTRLKNVKSVIYIAYANRRYEPYLFSLDTERSIRASYLLNDYRTLAREKLPEGIALYSTFMVPLFVVIKTAGRPVQDVQRQRLKELRRQLPRRFRRDLDDIRLFFRLGGLKNDPFA